MTTEQDIRDKWGELLDYSRQHATGEGMHTGFRWVQDAFNEYITMSDEVPGYGMGGQPGSMHNREVLAGSICLELGNHVGGRHLISEGQEQKLKATLAEIVKNQEVSKGLKR